MVRQSTYEKLRDSHADLQRKHYDLLRVHTDLVKKWNDVVDKINVKGGGRFLNGEILNFEQEDIKKLIVLCHPDKHGGSKAAEAMTAKLLTLRNKQ